MGLRYDPEIVETFGDTAQTLLSENEIGGHTVHHATTITRTRGIKFARFSLEEQECVLPRTSEVDLNALSSFAL